MNRSRHSSFNAIWLIFILIMIFNVTTIAKSGGHVIHIDVTGARIYDINATERDFDITVTQAIGRLEVKNTPLESVIDGVALVIGDGDPIVDSVDIREMDGTNVTAEEAMSLPLRVIDRANWSTILATVSNPEVKVNTAAAPEASTTAPEDVEAAPLVTITTGNAAQLEQWIPIDQDWQQSQEWLPTARGTLIVTSYSPTSHLLAVGSSTGLYLFDTNDLKKDPLHVDGLEARIQSASFSPDGTKVVVQISDKDLYIYSLQTQRLVSLVGESSTGRYSHLQFSADSATVFAAAYTRDTYKLVSWNAETGRRISSTEIPQISQFISAESRYWPSVPFIVTEDSYITNHPLAISLSNTTTVVQMWDRDTQEELLKLKLPAEASASGFYYSEVRNVFVTTGYQNNYQGALVWDASTGRQITTISTKGGPYLSPDGLQVWFYDSGTGVIRVWDIETRRFVQEYDFEDGQHPWYVSNNHIISTESQGTINVWQVDDTNITNVDHVQAFTGSTRDVLFTGSGDKLIVGLSYAGIQVWDTVSWTVENFIPIEKYIRAMALSPDSQSIAAAIGDGAPGDRLHIHDLETGDIITTLEYPNPFESVAYHPTEDYVAVGRHRGFDLALYSTRSGTMLSRFLEGGIPLSVAFSPDGTLVASGNADSKVRVYDTVTRGPAYVITGGGDVNSLAFSHDGTILAVGTAKLSFYDASTGQEIHSSEYLGSDINDMAFSPDDSLLATVRDGSFALWNVATGRLLWEREINYRYPYVAFHPDGNLIVTSHSGLSLWVVNTGADSDNDGVDDIQDGCPIHFGDVNGCPDSDADGLIDMNDNCPNEAGTAVGCPDDDNDGVGNSDDLCPQEIGSTAAYGCPDEDADGIVNSEDLCPSTAGIEQFNGCPDTDSDDIADTDDACPLYAGIPENEGCPYSGHANTNVNIRTSPSTSGSVVRSIPPSETFYIIGRNAAGDWLRIVLDPDGDATVAWVFESLVVTEIEISTLPIQE